MSMRSDSVHGKARVSAYAMVTGDYEKSDLASWHKLRRSWAEVGPSMFDPSARDDQVTVNVVVGDKRLMFVFNSQEIADALR